MENEIKFTHFVSKGGRFNQIYIPKEAEQEFEVGDKVEVRLIERNQKLHYSHNIRGLSEFKSNLIKDIFSCIDDKDINQIFIFGSFLTKKNDYNDIDVLIISEYDIEKRIKKELDESFDIKFHVIVIDEKKLKDMLKICPLTRSMFYYYVSNKRFEDLPSKEIDVNYIKYILMFPKDLLEVELESRLYYESLRRTESIYFFLNEKDIDPLSMDIEIEKRTERQLFNKIINNKAIDKSELNKLRKLIAERVNKIEEILRNGEKR